MTKIILICGLLASSFSSGADWKIYSISLDDTYISTYDKDSIKQAGVDSYKVWTNTTDQKLKINLIVNNYINCEKETLVQSDIYMYKEEKLLNSVLNQSDIVTPPPNSTGFKLINEICKKIKHLRMHLQNSPYERSVFI